MNKETLIATAKTFGIDTEGLTVDQLKEAIANAKAAVGDEKNDKESKDSSAENDSQVLGVKVVTESSEAAIANEPFAPIDFDSANGEKYKLIVPKFRYKGVEYQSIDVVVQMPDLIEELIKLKSFIILKDK